MNWSNTDGRDVNQSLNFNQSFNLTFYHPKYLFLDDKKNICHDMIIDYNQQHPFSPHKTSTVFFK